ncbi:MAG: hypothetical protein RL514_256 [Verrucomicrobiota bacterium]|jgi:PAS domain S-box-containing protein
MKQPIRVLVVEDEAPVAEIVQIELRRAGYTVAGVARTAADAVRLARELAPELILMDVHLDGDTTGIEAAREIANFCDAAVIYATGDVLDETVSAAVATGPYGYLTKPFSFHELRSTIEVTLYKHDIDRRLKESEARYRTLTQAIPQKVWTSDHVGQALFFNAEWVRYTGLSISRGLGYGWLAALHPLDQVSFTTAWERAVTLGAPFEIECRLARGADQGLRWHLARAVPLTGANGQRQWFGTFTDIEDEKCREAALRLSEAQKRAVLEAALDAIITVDHEGVIQEFNPAAERIFGRARFEAIGLPFVDALLAPASRMAHQQQLKQYLAAATGDFLGRRQRVTGQHVDGTEFPMELSFSLVPVTGQPLFTAYARDLSDQQREVAAQEQLQRDHTALLARHRAVTALVPTCHACRHVHLPGGTWGSFEQYLQQQGPGSPPEVLCPACETRLHPERTEKKFFRLWAKES